jgi:hypothetical protein
MSNADSHCKKEFDRPQRLEALVRSARAGTPRLTLDWLIIEFARRFRVERR